MWSNRFQKNIRLTDHAKYAMQKRGIPEAIVYDIIETGEIKHKDTAHVWIYKRYPERNDNLLCVAAVIGQAVIVKTVMTNWEAREI